MSNFQAAAPSEYLPDESEDQPASPPVKKGKTDPNTLRILEARNQAYGDPSLPRPVQAFVCFVIDKALHPGLYDYKGVVCMADSVPAEKFRVTERTVYNWRHTAGIEKYFWFTKKGRKNMWPMMVYHLTCLHAPPRLDQRTDSQGTYAGGGSDRVAPVADVAALGREKRNAALVKKRAQQTLPLKGGIAVVTGNQNGHPLPKLSGLLGISAEARKFVRLWAERNFGPEPKKISAESRKEFRPPAEKDFGPEPKNISAAGRNEARPPAEADCRHLETQNGVGGVSETSFKRSTLVNAQKAGQGRQATRVKNFLSDVRDMMELWKKGSSTAELTGSGVWWRKAFLRDEELMGKVLADTLSAVKESRVKTTPGQMAVNTWKRWGGELPKEATR